MRMCDISVPVLENDNGGLSFILSQVILLLSNSWAIPYGFLWNMRNKELHGEGRLPTDMAVNRTRSMIDEYIQAMSTALVQ